MKDTSFLSLVFVVIVLLLAVLLAGCTAQQSTAPATTAPALTVQQTTAPSGQPGSISVVIQNFAFSPQTVTVPKGTTVTWTNQDGVNHTVVNAKTDTSADSTLFKSDPLATGQSFSFTFSTPGTYPYHCSIHPGMTGTVIVT